jgi:hypothetical protein
MYSHVSRLNRMVPNRQSARQVSFITRMAERDVLIVLGVSSRDPDAAALAWRAMAAPTERALVPARGETLLVRRDLEPIEDQLSFLTRAPDDARHAPPTTGDGIPREFDINAPAVVGQLEGAAAPEVPAMLRRLPSLRLRAPRGLV